MPPPLSPVLGEGKRLLYVSENDTFLIARSPMVPVNPGIVQRTAGARASDVGSVAGPRRSPSMASEALPADAKGTRSKLIKVVSLA